MTYEIVEGGFDKIDIDIDREADWEEVRNFVANKWYLMRTVMILYLATEFWSNIFWLKVTNFDRPWTFCRQKDHLLKQNISLEIF